MTQQHSTAISDAVLSAVTGLFASIWFSRGSSAWISSNVYTALGLSMTIISVAAACGALRFAGVSKLIPLHDFLSSAGTCVAVPLAGITYFLLDTHFTSFLYPIQFVLIIIFITLYFDLTQIIQKSTRSYKIKYREQISTVGVILVAIKAGMRLMNHSHNAGSLYGILYTLLMIISGLVIGVTGTIRIAGNTMYRVDLFHYGLVIAYWCLYQAVQLD